jgi:hypothetical protein
MKRRSEQLIKKFVLIIMFSLIIAFTGCVYKPYYHPGYMGSQPAPILNSPTGGNTNYLGGTINYESESKKNEESVLGKLLFQRNHTYKYGSFSYHTEMFAGYHSIEAIEEKAGEKLNYYGLAPQLSGSLFYLLKESRLGFYGYTGMFWEFGKYDDWMDEAEEAELIWKELEDFNGKKLFGGGGFLFENIIDEKSMLSFKLGAGLPGGFHGMINYRKGSNIFNVGINELFESESVSFSYMRVW